MDDHPLDDTFCVRCARDDLARHTRRNEWQRLDSADGSSELVCPGCLTDADYRAIARRLAGDDLSENDFEAA